MALFSQKTLRGKFLFSAPSPLPLLPIICVSEGPRADSVQRTGFIYRWRWLFFPVHAQHETSLPRAEIRWSLAARDLNELNFACSNWFISKPNTIGRVPSLCNQAIIVIFLEFNERAEISVNRGSLPSSCNQPLKQSKYYEIICLCK